MNETDEKLLTLINVTVTRGKVVGDLHQNLERLSIYFEHRELMKKVDPSEVLLNDIQELLGRAYSDAIIMIASNAQPGSFSTLYDKLSDQGKDAYWAGNVKIDPIPRDCLPWWDLRAALPR